jgi:dipeptidyl aminopeptidase/acylaminoacyl peptidase
MSADDSRFEPAWSPDGRTIAFVSNKADYWADDVWLVDVASGESRQLSRGITAIGRSLHWSPRGDRLAVLGTARMEFWYLDLADIFLLDPSTGGETKVEMPIHVTAYGNRAAWSADGSHIYFVYQERGEDYIWAVPAAGGVATRVSHIGGVVAGFEASAGAAAFVFSRSSATEGTDIYYLSATGGPEHRLTNLAPKWAGTQQPVEVSYRTFDGLYIQGFLYLPPGLKSGDRCPSLVQVHGGGTNSYARGQNLIEQYLASKGFVVLAVNYRGGSGFGRAFQDLGVGDWANAQALDAGAAADYLRTLPYANGRVGIYGGSYGGTQSMAAITRTPEKFDAAVPMRGVYSQSLTFDLRDRVGKIFVKTGHGGTPDQRPDTYAKSNTINRLGNIRVPILIMHGELDDRAPYRNFELAVAELRRLGKDFEAKSYPGEGHGFRNPDNSIDMYTRLEGFFRKHLGSCEAAAPK